jgi:uncharacterized membrane protein YjfL (UPF0719 family)
MTLNSETLLQLFSATITNVPYFAVAIVLLFIGKRMFDLTTVWSVDEQLTDKDNPAVGLTLAGYFLGLAIAISGSLFELGPDAIGNLISIAVFGILSLLLMRASVFINDRFILNNFSIDKEIVTDQNLGTAAVVAGGCIANGFIIAGALMGDSSSFIVAVFDVVVYWATGQCLLIASSKIFQLITPYDAHKLIEEDDNFPVGMSFGGFLAGTGIIINGALNGASSNLVQEFMLVLSTWVVGTILMISGRYIADKVFLPTASLTKEVTVDKNPAAGVIACVSFICIALFISSTIGH